MYGPYAPVSFYERERAAGTVLIDMDAEGVLKPSGNRRDAIGTFGLCGCTALVVVMQLPDQPDSRVVGVAHYSPMAVYGRAYERFGALLSEEWQQGMQARSYIVTPGRYGTHPDTGAPYSLLPKDEMVTGLYSSALRVYVPSLEDVTVCAYSEIQKYNATEQGTVLVEFSDRDEPVRVYVEGRPV